ncbi:hypothetical protein JOL62DRAFT_579998 [Phyllosticta paracitricarpa]|uniref:Secreted protein n=1 Tax=Phyllosticta paracitricarpa TaxID=2016321 RepID=A0ABR1N120_9PEZI
MIGTRWPIFIVPSCWCWYWCWARAEMILLLLANPHRAQGWSWAAADSRRVSFHFAAWCSRCQVVPCEQSSETGPLPDVDVLVVVVVVVSLCFFFVGVEAACGSGTDLQLSGPPEVSTAGDKRLVD